MSDSTISVADYFTLRELPADEVQAAARMVARLCPDDAPLMLAALGIGGAP